MLTGFCGTVVSTNELHGNTLPERIVGSSAMLLSFGLAEECSCSVQVDRPALWTLGCTSDLLRELLIFLLRLVIWTHLPVASGMPPPKTIIVYLFLFLFSAWYEFFWEGLQCREQFRMVY
jgi:hypothetical protein